jgi:hypothetical protein
MKVSSYLCLQITGGAENAIPPHVDIPRTGGRGFDLSSYLCLQITGGAENAVPPHIDIPRTGGRGFDLHSEGSLQEYLKSP